METEEEEEAENKKMKNCENETFLLSDFGHS